jgi:tetratricopeptide (TPR) repeat protein
MPQPEVEVLPMEDALQAPTAADRALIEKSRTSDDLLKRMNDALKASATGANPAYRPGAPTIPGAPPPPPPPAKPARPNVITQPAARPAAKEPTQPNYQIPDDWGLAATAPAASPSVRKFGPGAIQEDDGDLWNLATQAPQRTGVASFEEALRRVDNTLDALVGQPQPVDEQPLVEATVESVEDGPLNDDTLDGDFDLGDPSDPAEAAKARRQRLLRKAMQNLGSMPNRGEPPANVNVAPVAPAPAAPAPPPAGAPAGGAITAADQKFAHEIDTRLEKAKGKKDLYALLGAPVGAGKDVVKAAFLNLAKQFHPDRLPPSLPHYREKVTQVFELIREAYDTLYDDARRAAYMSELQRNAGAPPPPRAAPKKDGFTGDELMKMGEALFKKREYLKAEEAFAKAHELEKSANALAAQGWAIYMDPARKAEAARAKQMMVDAAAIDPRCDRANYQLGVIARVEGDMNKAEQYFQRAVQLNPRHLEANQELRLIEMRKKKAQENKKGFFK